MFFFVDLSIFASDKAGVDFGDPRQKWTYYIINIRKLSESDVKKETGIFQEFVNECSQMVLGTTDITTDITYNITGDIHHLLELDSLNGNPDTSAKVFYCGHGDAGTLDTLL